MPESDAIKFRRNAEACQEQAAKTVNELDKQAWLRLANDWLKLAEAAETEDRK